MPANPSANRLDLDYRAEAERLGPPPRPIIDVHTHINGRSAARIFQKVMSLYGVSRVYSMTRFEEIGAIREILGERIDFIAVPNFRAEDRKAAFTTEWLNLIDRFADAGARVCKFWAAPRSVDFGAEVGEPDLLAIDGPWRRKAMTIARERGMVFMAHIADPDTWFATKYSDASRYGSKLDQYRRFEAVLDEFSDVPWIAAHMGGYPENLEFLSGLLERHPNLRLDTSATKWMARELSKHPRADLLAFLTRWNGRILFGSDIVTTDEHLTPAAQPLGMGHLASNDDSAFELYASRYWTLRTLWETDYKGESPIADPDLHMVDPERFTPDDAPQLMGQSLTPELLQSLYGGAAERALGLAVNGDGAMVSGAG